MNFLKLGVERLVALALMSLTVLAGPAFAEGGRKSLEQFLHEQAVQNVTSALEAGSANSEAAPAAKKAPAKVQPRRILSAEAADVATVKCLPTCNPTDGRFLAIAGSDLITLSRNELNLEIQVPAGATSFDLGFFDGDGSVLDILGNGNWDLGVLATYEYELFADPTGDGTGTAPVDILPGQSMVTSHAMPDNAWIDFSIATGPEALSPGGNYFYVLRVRLTNSLLTTLNAFKVRSTAVLSGVTLNPTEQPFSYIANWTGLSDISVVYPSFPSPTPTTYDGNFNFYFDVPTSQTDIAFWDGDFDRGNFDGTQQDTDDPDTPGAPFIPSWATGDALFEGVAFGGLQGTGNPADNRDGSGFGAFLLRQPTVRYDLVLPTGEVFANENPSGNQEWEQFKITTDPAATPADADHVAALSRMPAGTYRLAVKGVDMQNLNALLLPYRLLCEQEDGTPCTPLRPFRVGDTVYLDEDGDGTQDAGEAGIAGAELELVDDNGEVIGTATTDADGGYSFGTERGEYTVRVTADNFAEGGVLEGMASTTGGEEQTGTVLNDNVLTLDFGYRGTASLGDRVWEDTDGDGFQDDGEAGINGVTVRLLDGDGNTVATTVTAGDGEYAFTDLGAGIYTVEVDATTLPAGSTATYDLDGVATADTAGVTLTAGEERTDVDFGYQPAASIGDRLWNDLDGDGAQDAGEAGLNGVTVQLIDTNGNVVATQVTSGDGNYSFDDLAPGIYTVQVAAATLPAGSTQTYDLDGTGSANRATLSVDAGQDRTDVDFGYRQTNASIGDRLWYDADGDGAQDAGEPGLNGVTVQLVDGGGNVVASQATSGDGNYNFTNLPAGSYTVRVVASTLPAGGLSPTFDADGTGTPHTAVVILAAGQARTEVDFGYRGTRSIGDRVWNDTDGDGVQDAGETGINGVTVRLFLGATEVASTVTAGNGNYTFPNLPETTFTVRVDAATLPAGVTPTFDLDGTATPHQATVNLTTSRADVDFGYRTQPVSCTPGYFKDHFSSASFSNNDGTLSWAGPWIESDTAGAGVNSGNVTVGKPYAGYLFLRDYPDTGTQPSAARQANLSGFASATMSFSFHVRTGVDPSDAVVVEVSKDGGATYTVLETLTGFSGTAEASRSYNVSAYIASNFRVRFRVSSGYGASDELFKLDWIKIEGSCAPSQPEAPGTGTIGYWKNHSSAWPVSSIQIGGKTYTKSQAISLIGTASRGDKTIDLAKQLIAAKLNVLIGNEAGCISSTISAADAWLVAHPVGSNVSSSSSAWSQGGPLHTKLDDYNNGRLCAPHRG